MHLDRNNVKFFLISYLLYSAAGGIIDDLEHHVSLDFANVVDPGKISDVTIHGSVSLCHFFFALVARDTNSSEFYTVI
jgi:hypothetical protein